MSDGRRHYASSDMELGEGKKRKLQTELQTPKIRSTMY